MINIATNFMIKVLNCLGINHDEQLIMHISKTLICKWKRASGDLVSRFDIFNMKSQQFGWIDQSVNAVNAKYN